MSKKKILNFISSNYALIALFLYGLFLIFTKTLGSLHGDEAIYAQVAKETLAKYAQH